MRALMRPLSTHTVFSPIETIVAVFVLSTLAYFRILDGIKHSSFFVPTFPSILRPANARLSQGEWLPVTEREWFNAWKHGEQVLELQQILFSLDDKARKVRIYLSYFLSGLRSLQLLHRRHDVDGHVSNVAVRRPWCVLNADIAWLGNFFRAFASSFGGSGFGVGNWN